MINGYGFMVPLIVEGVKVQGFEIHGSCILMKFETKATDVFNGSIMVNNFFCHFYAFTDLLRNVHI